MSEPFIIDCPTCKGTGCHAGNGAACERCGQRGWLRVVEAK